MDFKIYTASPNILHGIVTPPLTGPVNSLDIVAVCDVSYSMHDAANSNGTEGAQYYSKLDLLKRAIEIIAKSMKDTDHLTIITYSTNMVTVLPRTAMDTDGQARAMNAVTAMRPGGGTALYAGLVAGLKEAAATNGTVALLTDGEPSQSPPEGDLQALKSYREITNNTCCLYTIGMGYSINSALLNDLAKVGNTGGSFTFIPDGTMVITSFINRIANERCTAGKNLIITVTGNGASNFSTKSSYVTEPVKDGFKVHMGAIKYGQQRDILIEVPNFIDIGSVVISASYVSTESNKTVSIPASYNESLQIIPVTKQEIIRCDAIRIMSDILKIGSFNVIKSREMLEQFVDTIPSFDVPIISDILGEVAKALSANDQWSRWGKHYLLALKAAHEYQECTNFKDPGLQSYGGDMFRDIKKDLNDICDTLPVLQASLTPSSYSSYSYSSPSPYYTQCAYKTLSAQAPAATPVAPTTTEQFNRVFNNQSGGCFGLMGQVKMNDGTTKLVKDITKGDILHNNSEVECVVSFANVETVMLNNLSITPWHPVFIHNMWQFPDCILGHDAVRCANTEVRTFVLKSGHLVIIDDIVACTLAHGFNGQVIYHEFYGTEKVRHALMKFPGWEDGFVSLTHANEVYDPKTTQVCDYKLC